MEKNKRKRTIKKYTASQQLNAMATQWADLKTICIIGGIGMNKALEIKKAIVEQIENDGYRVPKQPVVPMRYVIDYFGIDINYLKRLAKLERVE